MPASLLQGNKDPRNAEVHETLGLLQQLGQGGGEDTCVQPLSAALCFGVPALGHGFCVRICSLIRMKGGSLLSWVVVGDRMTASIDPRAGWKIAVSLYFVVFLCVPQ